MNPVLKDANMGDKITINDKIWLIKSAVTDEVWKIAQYQLVIEYCRSLKLFLRNCFCWPSFFALSSLLNFSNDFMILKLFSIIGCLVFLCCQFYEYFSKGILYMNCYQLNFS